MQTLISQAKKERKKEKSFYARITQKKCKRMLVSFNFSNNWVVKIKDEKWKIPEGVAEHENRVFRTLSKTLST